MAKKRAQMTGFDIAAVCSKHGITKKMIAKYLGVSDARIHRWWKTSKIPNAYLQKIKEIDVSGIPEQCAQYSIILHLDPTCIELCKRIVTAIEKLTNPAPPAS